MGTFSCIDLYMTCTIGRSFVGLSEAWDLCKASPQAAVTLPTWSCVVTLNLEDTSEAAAVKLQSYHHGGDGKPLWLPGEDSSSSNS